MLVNYLTVNFWPIMILFALIVIMIVNRDVKIPATKLFVVSILVVLALTVAGTFDINKDVSALVAKEAQSIVATRTIACVIMYVLRPIVILAELIIVLHDYKYKYLCVIPAIFNAVVYVATLFGAKITFWIDEENHWHGGPLKYTIYCTLLFYLFLLLLSSVHSFTCGEKRKSLILIVMFAQAVLVSFHSKNIPTARLVWHCPCVDIFTSDDGKVNGKEGFDATVSFAVRGNKITITTENAGIFMKDVLTITDIDSKIYATITGDQVALTNIKIN